jgi:hypothetical protein
MPRNQSETKDHGAILLRAFNHYSESECVMLLPLRPPMVATIEEWKSNFMHRRGRDSNLVSHRYDARLDCFEGDSKDFVSYISSTPPSGMDYDDDGPDLWDAWCDDDYATHDVTPHTQGWKLMRMTTILAEVTLGGITWNGYEKYGLGSYESNFIGWRSLTSILSRHNAT